MMKHYLLIISCFFLFSISSLYSQTEKLIPPSAAKITWADTIHGDIRQDEYHWMRQKTEPQLINHLYAENGYSDRVMAGSSLLMKKMFEEMRVRIPDQTESLPSRMKKYLYFTRYEKGMDYPAYFRKADSLNAPEVPLINFNEIAKTYNYFNISALGISPDNQKMYYGIDTKGDRIFNLFFKDILTGSVLTDTLKNINGICWMGNDAVLYTIPEPKTKRSYRVYKHILGQNTIQDEFLFEEKDVTFNIGLSRSDSERFIFLNTSQTMANEVYVMDLNDAQPQFKLVEPRRRGHQYGLEHYEGNEFIISSDDQAPNLQILTCPISNSRQKNWKVLVPHRKDVMIANSVLAGGKLLVVEQFDAQQKIAVLDLKDNSSYYLPSSTEPASMSLGGYYEYNESKVRYSFTSMRFPSEVWDYDLNTGERTLIRRDTLKGGYDPEKYSSERIYAIAADSARIPITIIYKKGLQKNGSNPAWLQSYGSYGNPSLPGFSSSNISLLERGFVVAVAHIRGGNDCGRLWYENGKLFKKKNTFTDFISAAEKLISDGYTKSGKLAIQGGSAGGLLMGAVVNMRPDLFGAVVANVPFVDVINTMLDASLPLTTFEYDEWGNPNDPAYYAYMKSYAPYENVSAQAYPHMLVTGGYNDSQVPYWEPSKWVARMRSLKTDTNLLLLKINMEAGHGGNSGRYGAMKDRAFEMAFVLRSLGIKEEYLQIKGKTTDIQGNELPFVNVFIEGTSIGTASNENGNFSLDLKQENNQNLVASSIGFKKKVLPITISTDVQDLRIALEPENYQIKTFEVKANAKDPAYAVMKNAIRTRKEHLEQVDAFSSDIYIKGSVRLNEIPKKRPIFISKENMPDSTDLGLVYLSESVARYHVRQPSDYKEEMIASKVAGMKQGFSWNRVSDVLMNFYENLLEFDYYSERGFVSPVSESAMFYYKYKMIGTFVDNGKTINRIALEPKRKNDPCFRGEIFIVDDSWHIHSVDLYLTKDAQIQFVDTLYIKQEYTALEDSIWMPLSMQLMSHIKFFGFGAVDKSVGVFSNYKLHPVYPKNFFGNEIFRIEEKANKKDTVYWTETRPMTLTPEEEKNYRKADSTEIIQTSKPYLDSLDKVNNRFNPAKFIVGGYAFRNSFSKSYLNINPLITMLSYNVTEGVYLQPRVSYSKSYENYRSWFVEGVGRYGFSDERLKGGIKAWTMTNRTKFNWWYLDAGRFVSQVNGEDPISPLVNACYSLIDKQNLIRTFEKTGATISWNREISNGWMLQASAAWYDRKSYGNKSDYSLSRKITQEYASNYTIGNDPMANVTNSQIALISIKSRFNIHQKYESRGNLKIIRGSQWPSIFTEITQAIPDVFGSDVKYTHLEIAVSDDMKMGLIGESHYKVSAGTFIGKSGMQFVDNQHFNGNETFLLRNTFSSIPFDFFQSSLKRFNALNYYSNSTSSAYLELHYEHQFHNWLTNKIPLLRKTHFGTVAGANVLWVESKPLYTELFLGIDNILQVLRIDFVSQYTPGQALKPLIRFGLKL